VKKILIFMSVIFLISLVSAIGTTDIIYKIKVNYEPSGNCSISCSNSTSGNTTTETCYETCQGIIKIEGLEENHLMVIENLNDINGRSYTGYKTADLGNESDITGIVVKLDECLTLNEKLNLCMATNSNISAQFIMMGEDVGYKENYTNCNLERTNLNNQISEKNQELKEVQDELKQWDTNKLVWGAVAFLLGMGFIKLGLPYLQNKDKHKDESDKQFPGGASY